MRDSKGSQCQLSDSVELSRALQDLAISEVPRIFAIGAEYDHGNDNDNEIVAWGLAFDGHTEVVAVEGDYHLRTSTPAQALRHFSESGARMYIVWV